MSCSLKLHDFVTEAPMTSLPGLVCGPCQFLLQFSVVVPSFSLLTFFHFLCSSILIIIAVESVACLLSSQLSPTQSLAVSNTHFLILFQCTSTLIFSHVTAPSFSSTVHVSCTFCHSACHASKSYCSFCFWSLMISFNTSI